jgi:hypothetical protein
LAPAALKKSLGFAPVVGRKLLPVPVRDRSRQPELEHQRAIVAAEHEQKPQARDRIRRERVQEGGQGGPLLRLVEDQELLELIDDDEEGVSASLRTILRRPAEQVEQRKIGRGLAREQALGFEQRAAELLDRIAEKAGLDDRPAGLPELRQHVGGEQGRLADPRRSREVKERVVGRLQPIQDGSLRAVEAPEAFPFALAVGLVPEIARLELRVAGNLRGLEAALPHGAPQGRQDREQEDQDERRGDERPEPEVSDPFSERGDLSQPVLGKERQGYEVHDEHADQVDRLAKP